MDSKLLLTFVGLLISIYNLLDSTEKRYVKYRLKKTDFFSLIFLFGFLTIQGFYDLKEKSNIVYYWSIFNLLYISLMSLYYFNRFKNGKFYNIKSFIQTFIRNYELKNFNQNILDMREQFDLFKNKKNKELEKCLYDMCDNSIFIKEVSEQSPREGMEIFINNDNLRMESKQKFIREFYKELILNENSQFFYQLKTINEYFNYYGDGHNLHSYHLSDEEYFLYPFLNKDLLADSFLCNPIREAAHLYLKNQALKNKDENNNLDGYISNKNKWNNPIYICISFTDFVVREGIRNKTDDPMFLYMHTDIVEGILENIKYTDTNFTENGEWVNNYEYYLDEVVGNMISWSKSSIIDQSYFCPKIFDYALLMLFSSIKSILNKKIREEFKIDLLKRMLEMYLEVYKINTDKGTEILKKFEKYFFESEYLVEILDEYDMPSLWYEKEKEEAFKILKKKLNEM